MVSLVKHVSVAAVGSTKEYFFCTILGHLVKVNKAPSVIGYT